MISPTFLSNFWMEACNIYDFFLLRLYQLYISGFKISFRPHLHIRMLPSRQNVMSNKFLAFLIYDSKKIKYYCSSILSAEKTDIDEFITSLLA